MNMSFNIYINCNPASWHHLIKNCLHPLIQQMKDKGLIHDFYLTLNAGRIQLTILTSPDRKEECFRTTDDGVGEYLSVYPSLNDSIWYDVPVTNPFFSGYPLQQMRNKVKSCLSINMIMALTDAPIERKSSLIYLTYLLFAIIQLFIPDPEEAKKGIQRLLHGGIRDHQFFDAVSFASNRAFSWQRVYEEYRPSLLNICENVWVKTTYDEDLSWLAEWKKMIGNIPFQDGFEDCFPDLLLLIHDQLGIPVNSEMTQSLLTVLYNTLDSFCIS